MRGPRHEDRTEQHSARTLARERTVRRRRPATSRSRWRQGNGSAASWAGDAQPGPKSTRRCLFCTRLRRVFQAPGGGENQLVQTGIHLEQLGVPVRLFSPWTDRLESARLLHLFGMSREGLELAQSRAGAASSRRALADLLVRTAALWPRSNAGCREAREPGRAGACDRWCPRCRAGGASSCSWPISSCPIRTSEANQLVRLFGVPREQIRVVPNGVLPSIASASPDLFHSRWGAEPFVLFVGRIEPRKNPLGLIKALRGLGLPLVVIGEAPPGCEEYERACRRAGTGHVSWLGRARPSRSGSGLGLCGRAGLRPAELVRDPGAGRPRGRARRLRRSRSRPMDRRETTSATWCNMLGPTASEKFGEPS